MPTIFLGFELGSAQPVHVPFAHTVVCGQTQASGKTTTLEAMLSRTGHPARPALAFLTKRAEGAFVNARRIPPYFRDHADWQFVESILEAMMRERMKYERQWIIRVCQGARSLFQVAQNVETALHGDGKHKKPATGFAAGMYLQLSEYFKLILPELKRLQLDMAAHGTRLELESGMNIMDLSEYSTEMQSLAIASSMEEVYRMRRVITVIPEAWEFLPQARNTPVKLAGESLIRKGAAAENFMWLDSQDITGVDKRVLKQVGVWILGVQREVNEVEHTLSQMGVPAKLKPKPEQVMQLRRGQFYVCFEDVLKLVYVLPSWIPPGVGEIIARNLPGPKGEEDIRSAVAAYQPKYTESEHQNMDYKLEYEKAVQRINTLEEKINQLERTLDHVGKQELETIVTKGAEAIKAPRTQAPTEKDQVTLELDVKRPELNVTIRRVTIEMNDEQLIGQLAILIYEGFFESPKKTEHINDEFRARGWAAQTGRPSPKNLEMAKLAEYGFIRIVGQGSYQAMPDMKVNLKEVRSVA